MQNFTMSEINFNLFKHTTRNGRLIQNLEKLFFKFLSSAGFLERVRWTHLFN